LNETSPARLNTVVVVELDELLVLVEVDVLELDVVVELVVNGASCRTT
jgi:hypothetical protein